ncbi:MAG: hypothetical protein KGJ90_04610 [Patescibacteria group bacterium]|nr:hypothetical protein [Patescibacteria group bacterium]
MPALTVCQVIAHDPANGGLVVLLTASAQLPGFPIKVGYDGPADALRVRQKPLPGIGTWGIVAFPRGDIRNGIWLRSYYPSLVDAIHYSNDPGGRDPFIDYESHFSGFWSLMDGYGNTAAQWPDGSYVTFGSGTTLPTIYRHTVTGQTQNRSEFTFAERVLNAPSTFSFNFQQASGTSVSLNSSGSVVVSGAPLSSFTILMGQATLNISNGGLVTLALPGTETFNITQGSGSPTDQLALVSKLVSWLANHTHSGVQTGSSDTGTPVQSITAATIESDIFEVSG